MGAGVSTDGMSFFDACYSGNLRAVQQFISRGQNVNEPLKVCSGYYSIRVIIPFQAKSLHFNCSSLIKCSFYICYFSDDVFF